MWAIRAVLAVLCSAVAIFVRTGIDVFLPGASPFILIYPAVMVATLLGRWQAGCLTLAILILNAWYVLIPLQYRDVLVNGEATDWLALAFASGVTTIIMAEFVQLAFRRRVRERKEKIELQELLLREVNHRAKNNFSMVISLLALQRQNTLDVAAREALATAALRVRALAQANDNIYSNTDGVVDLKPYISALCDAISTAVLSPAGVMLICESAPVKMERDRAVAIGLIINELLLNAAKHAFKGRTRGQIAVRLDDQTTDLTLSVSDDGIGFSQEVREGALGKKLIQALCARAGGDPIWYSDMSGTKFVLKLAPSKAPKNERRLDLKGN
jgi:two-component sensor histidine kinase